MEKKIFKIPLTKLDEITMLCYNLIHNKTIYFIL